MMVSTDSWACNAEGQSCDIGLAGKGKIGSFSSSSSSLSFSLSSLSLSYGYGVQ